MSSSDYKFNEKKTVPVSKVLEFEKALYTAAGMSEQDADCVARTLVEADARGTYSHGIQRNGIYLKRFEEGGNDPVGRPGSFSADMTLRPSLYPVCWSEACLQWTAAR